ncbi:MAG: type IV pilus modification PilV family protein [Armatimonadota bacterium]
MKLLKAINNQKGISLIEVLVAMVIFVAGILYVLQIFPGGFNTVKQSEYQTMANRLAQSELERLKGRIENLPEGIVAINPQDINTTLVNLDATSLQILPNAPAGGERYFSDANRFRRIIGEVTKIPVPMASDTEWANGAPYTLNFSPIDNNRDVTVYSNPMRRQSLTADTRWLVWMGMRDYSINYDEGLLYVRRADYDREYLISYSYWDQSGTKPRLITVNKVTIMVTAKTNNDPDPEEVKITGPDQTTWVKDLAGYAGIEEGTDNLRRKFTNLTTSINPDGTVPWGTNDPYEFAIRDSAAGVLVFNPMGYEYQELTATGKEKLTAYIDYDVIDWHVIREERKVPHDPASPNDDYINVKLSLRGIKVANGTTNYDNTKYLGVTPGLPYSVIAVDTETGQVYNEESQVAVLNVSALKVNYRDGIIGFHANEFRDHSFVIMYQAVDDWAVQVFKPFSRYNRRYDIPANLDNFGYDNYYLGNDERIYFPKCYAGATIAVNYAYRLNGSTTDSFVNGESFQISTDTDNGNGLCYVDIKQNLLDSGKTNFQITQLNRVYGTSIGVRVIWRVSGRGLASSWRWRKVDVQSYLTRPNN